MRQRLLLAMAGMIVAPTAYAASPPRFEDYPVKVEQPAMQHAPLLDSKPPRVAPFWKESRSNFTQYRTRLSWPINGEEVKPFAGHYRISEWGCGTGCQESAIVDNITGKIYGFFSTNYGLDFRPDSTLLIVNPGLDEAVAEGYLSDQHTSYWRWNGHGLDAVKR